MKKGYLLLFLILATPTPVFSQFFPYTVAKKTLKNQLDVVVIETPEFRCFFREVLLTFSRSSATHDPAWISESDSAIKHV